MKKVRVEKLPKCNFCKEGAKFDGPTTDGPWAYMCPACNNIHGVSTTLGSEFVLGIAEPKGRSAVNGTLDLDRSMSEDMLIIECPECRDEKHLKLDASGTYVCGGCGVTINIPSIK